MSENLISFEKYSKPRIEKVLARAEEIAAEPVTICKNENPTPQEKTINDIYDGMVYHVKDVVDKFSDDLSAPYNEDLVRSYVALLDLAKKFADADLTLHPNIKQMSRRGEVKDEIYSYVTVGFTSVGVSYKGEIMIRPWPYMKSSLSESEKDHDADQRMQFEVTPLTPDISTKAHVRIDYTGVVEYDLDARKPGFEGNIIDEKEGYLRAKGVDIKGGHHIRGLALKGYRSEYKSILERIHQHAETRLSRAA